MFAPLFYTWISQVQGVNMYETHHINQRVRQRGITKRMIGLTLEFGDVQADKIRLGTRRIKKFDQKVYFNKQANSNRFGKSFNFVLKFVSIGFQFKQEPFPILQRFKYLYMWQPGFDFRVDIVVGADDGCGDK